MVLFLISCYVFKFNKQPVSKALTERARLWKHKCHVCIFVAAVQIYQMLLAPALLMVSSTLLLQHSCNAECITTGLCKATAAVHTWISNLTP